MNLHRLEEALRKHDEECPVDKEFGRRQIELYMEVAKEALHQGGEVVIGLEEGGKNTFNIVYRGEQPRVTPRPGVEQQ